MKILLVIECLVIIAMAIIYFKQRNKLKKLKKELRDINFLGSQHFEETI